MKATTAILDVLAATPDAWRQDRAESVKFTIDADGFARIAEATLTTVGILEYPRSDGRIVREFRPAVEVQSERFLESLRNCVVTDEHPPGAMPVNAGNFREYGIGSTGTDVRVNGLRVDSSLVVRDPSVIAKIKTRRDQGLETGVSVGYRCKVLDTPGIWNSPDGPRPYDAIQYGHVANHVAITVSPRGGLNDDGSKLRLDAKEEDSKMEVTKFDLGSGVFVDVATAHAPLLRSELNRLDSVVKDEKVRQVDLASKLATAEAEAKALAAKCEQLTIDSKIDLGALIANRVALTDRAVKVIGKDALDKIDSAAADYADQVIDACLGAHKVQIPVNLSAEAKHAYRLARFDALTVAPVDAAHNQLSAAIVARGSAPSERDTLEARIAKVYEKRSAHFNS